MSKPLLYDVFCGGGGATRGYQRAGFRVVGIDNRPQPRYCGDDFIQMDALAFLGAVQRGEFPHPDAIHASPPCQAYSRHVYSESSPWNDTLGKDEPALVDAVRGVVATLGIPYVIENVPGAPLPTAILLCGTMFGLPITRHRLFECVPWVMAPGHPSCRGVSKRYAERMGWDWRDMSVTGKGRHAGTSERWASVMGIDWPMRQRDLKESIPPSFTEYLGRQLLAYVMEQAA